MLNNSIPTQNIRRNNQKESLSNFEHSDTSSDYENVIDFPNNNKVILDTLKIRNSSEKKLHEKADLIGEKNLSLQQKILIYLSKNNSSSESGDDNDENNNFSYNYNVNDNDSFYEESTTDCSSYISVQLDEKNKYYIQYNLYDNITIWNNNKKKKLPKLIQLDKNKVYYLYLNKLNTYFFTKSAYLGKNKPINDDDHDSDECKLNELYGLYFCGKTIVYNNESTICSPNNMICKICMQKNKKRYNLKDKYLININGRVSKKIGDGDKGFHCFGHFFFGKIQIEICLNKYCCMACKLLNKYENYYS